MTFTGKEKPEGDLGALVNDRIHDSYKKINEIEQQLNEEKRKIKQVKEQLNEEKRKREEADLILANHVANIENLLIENNMLKRDNEIVNDAHTTLFYCQVCYERQRNTRLHPCGHVIICSECASNILNSTNKRCPICRAAIIETHRALVI